MQLERIGYVIGVLVMVTAIFMLAPMIADLMNGSDDWKAFAHALAINLTLAGLLILATRDRWSGQSVSLREAFVTTSLSWLVVPLAGCLPLYFKANGLSFVDAWFESVSGMTTTGSTVMSGLDREPAGILLWRSLLQWIGGVGIILMAMLILPFLRVGGMQIFRTESSDRSEKFFTRDAELIPRIAITFVVLTAACMASYMAAGMRVFDALNHALTTIPTGGFSTHDASLAHYKTPGVHWVAAVFMFAGSLPIILYIRTWPTNFSVIWRDVQVRGFTKIVITAVAVVTVYLGLTGTYAWTDAIRIAAVNVISIISTTGYALDDFTAWGPGANGIFLILMFLGGCTGSTAGSIKTYRLQAMALITRRYVDQLFSPRRVMKLRYGNRTINEEIILSILAFLTAFAGSIIAVTLALTLFGVELLTAFSGAVTAITNVGPGLGSEIGPSGNFAGLPSGAKVVLIFAMILGRLEFFALLVLLSPRFWR
jgi:trk system potassium uptake protein TrkH